MDAGAFTATLKSLFGVASAAELEVGLGKGCASGVTPALPSPAHARPSGGVPRALQFAPASCDEKRQRWVTASWCSRLALIRGHGRIQAQSDQLAPLNADQGDGLVQRCSAAALTSSAPLSPSLALMVLR